MYGELGTQLSEINDNFNDIQVSSKTLRLS